MGHKKGKKYLGAAFFIFVFLFAFVNSARSQDRTDKQIKEKAAQVVEEFTSPSFKADLEKLYKIGKKADGAPPTSATMKWFKKSLKATSTLGSILKSCEKIDQNLFVFDSVSIDDIPGKVKVRYLFNTAREGYGPRFSAFQKYIKISKGSKLAKYFVEVAENAGHLLAAASIAQDIYNAWGSNNDAARLKAVYTTGKTMLFHYWLKYTLEISPPTTISIGIDVLNWGLTTFVQQTINRHKRDWEDAYWKYMEKHYPYEYWKELFDRAFTPRSNMAYDKPRPSKQELKRKIRSALNEFWNNPIVNYNDMMRDSSVFSSTRGGALADSYKEPLMARYYDWHIEPVLENSLEKEIRWAKREAKWAAQRAVGKLLKVLDEETLMDLQKAIEMAQDYEQASIAVEPERVTLEPGDTEDFTASLEIGEYSIPLSNEDVKWNPPGGRVAADDSMAGKTLTVEASLDGKTGTATVVVRRSDPAALQDTAISEKAPKLDRLAETVAAAEVLSRESQKYCSKAKYLAAEAQDAASTLREEAQQLKEQIAKLAPEVDRMGELQTRISREHKNAETATAQVEQTTSKIEELSLQICRKAKGLANASQTRAEQLLTQIEKLGADLKMLRSQSHKYADEADAASRNAEKNAAAFAGIADRLARLGDQDDLADILMEKQQLLDKADRNLAANREKIQQLAVKNKQARGLIAEAASLLHTHDYQKNEKSYRKQLNELTGRLKRTVRNAESCQSQARKASQNAREALVRVMEKVIAASASRKDLLRGSRATQKDPDRVLEKAELAEFLAQLAQGYVEEIENLAADSTFCLLLARDQAEKTNYIAIPDLRGQDADRARRILRQKGFTVQQKEVGTPPSQRLAQTVKSQKPASGEKVRTGATVTLEVYAQFDPQALLANVDCSDYPNTKPAYDPDSGRTGCACKPFFVPDTNGPGCVDCQQLKKSFHQLLRQNRLKSAEGQLARAGNCAFQEQAHAEISMHRNRIIACEKRNTAILRAVRQRDTQSAYSQIRNAQDFGCKVDPEVISIYNQLAQQVQRETQLHAEQRRRRDQREAFNTFIQGMNAITQNIERQRRQNRNPPPRTRRNNPLTGALPSANPGDPLNDYSFSTSPEPAGSRHTGVSSGGQSSTTTGGTAGSGMSRSDCIKKFCPICLQQSEVTMIGVSADEQCEDCKKKYAAKIAACEKGRSTGAGNTLESFQKYYLYKCWFKKVVENYESTYFINYMTGPGEPSLGSRKRAEVNSQKSQCISCERIMGPDTREKIRLGGGSDLQRHYINE